MTENPSKAPKLVLDDPWFASDERVSEPPPESVDPALDDWFAKGQPLSSRPPPADSAQ